MPELHTIQHDYIKRRGFEMTTITHETTIGATGGKPNAKGKMIPLAGKLQISNAKLIPAIGRKAHITIEYDEVLPEDNCPELPPVVTYVEPEKANQTNPDEYKEIIGVQ
jgi:hypothetical protein